MRLTRLTLCCSMATPFLVQSKTDGLESQRHSKSSEYHCKQTILSGSGHSDRMLSLSGGI